MDVGTIRLNLNGSSDAFYIGVDDAEGILIKSIHIRRGGGAN